MVERKSPLAIELAKGQREISVSEFFTKNRHLLGFDNPRKALLTTIKEGVDNSLDATSEMGVLPEIFVTIESTSVENRFKIVVEDNGPGIVKKQIPRIFAKLLYGSKFHKLKCSRGQQGLGISAAAMYGQLTTGKPVKIISKIDSKKPAYYCELHIDTKTNEPEILKEEEMQWKKNHGTRVEIELEAKYLKGKQSVDDYLKQTAIANPHAQIIYKNPEKVVTKFSRGSKELPKEPREIKPHPYGVELGTLIKMLKETESSTLQSFLQNDFCRVSARVAKEICEKGKLYERARPSRIARQEGDKLLKVIHGTKIMAPPTNCLTPIGEELIIKGLKKEVDAEFYAAVTRPPAVYRGFPFQLEVGVAHSGSLPTDCLVRVMRFANRVPLLYQQSACAITKSIINTAWRNYGLSQSKSALPSGPALILVHLASVWVPFTSESKEAIAHYPEIMKEIKLALQEAGRKLATHIRKRKREEYEIKKRDYIEKYLPHISFALKEICSLSNVKEKQVVKNLKKILERSRK